MQAAPLGQDLGGGRGPRQEWDGLSSNLTLGQGMGGRGELLIKVSICKRGRRLVGDTIGSDWKGTFFPDLSFAC